MKVFNSDVLHEIRTTPPDEGVQSGLKLSARQVVNSIQITSNNRQRTALEEHDIEPVDGDRKVTRYLRRISQILTLICWHNQPNHTYP
jgi:hypothetical protein